MNIDLNQETRTKLFSLISGALKCSHDQDIVEAFANVISFDNDGFGSLTEIFALADALAQLVFIKSRKNDNFCLVSANQLTLCVGSKKSAVAALRLNGFVQISDSDCWTNSATGRGKLNLSIPEDFFANYLKTLSGSF